MNTPCPINHETQGHVGLGEGGELPYIPSTRSHDIAKVLIQSQNLGLILGSHGLDAVCLSPLHRQEQLLTPSP